MDGQNAMRAIPDLSVLEGSYGWIWTELLTEGAKAVVKHMKVYKTRENSLGRRRITSSDNFTCNCWVTNCYKSVWSHVNAEGHLFDYPLCLWVIFISPCSPRRRGLHSDSPRRGQRTLDTPDWAMRWTTRTPPGPLPPRTQRRRGWTLASEHLQNMSAWLVLLQYSNTSVHIGKQCIL